METVEKKPCTKCGLEKQLDLFSRKKKGKYGRSSICKVCASAYMRRYHIENREKQLADMRRYYQNHKDRWVAWRAANPERHRESVRLWQSRHPERYVAQRLVKQAIKVGDLVPSSTCELCGISGPVEAHHHDYRKPLEVEWLCTVCHGLRR